jgi:hypothetical protein
MRLYNLHHFSFQAKIMRGCSFYMTSAVKQVLVNCRHLKNQPGDTPGLGMNKIPDRF